MRLRVAHLMARMMAPSILHMQILQGMSGAAAIYALFWLHASPLWWLVSLGGLFRHRVSRPFRHACIAA